MFAFDDFLESLDRVGNLDVLAFETGELLSNKEEL